MNSPDAPNVKRINATPRLLADDEAGCTVSSGVGEQQFDGEVGL